MAVKFKDRYVLATGYVGSSGARGPFSMTNDMEGEDDLTIKSPDHLTQRDAPRYRLVLERVKGKK